jgi:hypothetical protein
LWCYDKKLDRAYQQSPDRLGGETLFYDLPDADKQVGVSQFLEKWFHPLEGAASKTLCVWRDKLATSAGFSPTEEELGTMAEFLVVQQLRTPRGRREAVDIALIAGKMDFYNFLGQAHPEVAGKIKNPFKELPIELPKARWPHAHAMSLMDVGKIEMGAEILMGHIWVVTENLTRWANYTSDHPVARVPHVHHPFRAMSGVRSRGIQILFPLTPRFSLNLCERTFWRDLEGYDRRLLRQPMAKENVDYDNSVQVAHSARFIYSRDADFDLAKDMCAREPDLRNPDRPELESEMGSTPHGREKR